MLRKLICIMLAIGFLGSAYGQDKSDMSSFPLHLFPQGDNNTIVLYVTGDGGWSAYNQQIPKSFVTHGYSVIAMNSRKYFWSKKSPETFAHDVESILKYYMQQWKKTHCIIVGYSFGADVVSFLPSRMPELKSKISGIGLLSPAVSTDFTIHINDMLFSKEVTDYKYKTKAEIQACQVPTICIFGESEDLALKKELAKTSLLDIIELPGAHGYDDDAETPVDRILTFLNTLKK